MVPPVANTWHWPEPSVNLILPTKYWIQMLLGHRNMLENMYLFAAKHGNDILPSDLQMLESSTPIKDSVVKVFGVRVRDHEAGKHGNQLGGCCQNENAERYPFYAWTHCSWSLLKLSKFEVFSILVFRIFFLFAEHSQQRDASWRHRFAKLFCFNLNGLK